MEDERLQYSRQCLIHGAVRENDIKYHLGPDCMGSKGCASEQVADSLALCCEYGRPSLFITETTDQHWLKIQDRLYNGQNASDQPGVVARTVKEHFSLMMKAIS